MLVSNSADGGSGVATVVFQRSPVGAGTWTNQAAELGHDRAGRRRLRPPRDHDRQRGQLLHLGADHGHGRQHRPEPVGLRAEPGQPLTPDPAIDQARPPPTRARASTTSTSSSATDLADLRLRHWTTLGSTRPRPTPSRGRSRRTARACSPCAVDNAGLQTAEIVPVTIDRTRPAGSLTAPAAARISAARPSGSRRPPPMRPRQRQHRRVPALDRRSRHVHRRRRRLARRRTRPTSTRRQSPTASTTCASSRATRPATPSPLRRRSRCASTTRSDRHDHGSARAAERARHGRADRELGRLRLRRRHRRQFQRSPAGAGTWTNQAASLEHDRCQADGLYDLRVVTTDNAGNSFTSGCHDRARRQHAPDRRGHRARRPARTSAARSQSRATRPTRARASRPSSSSARRPVPAPGRTRPRAGTRRCRPTASTTSAS